LFVFFLIVQRSITIEGKKDATTLTTKTAEALIILNSCRGVVLRNLKLEQKVSKDSFVCDVISVNELFSLFVFEDDETDFCSL